MLKNKVQILLTVVFLAYAIWWISFQHTVIHGNPATNWFGNTYGIMALLGAIIGFATFTKWGGFKSIVGKALLFFSLGLLAQEAGQLIYSYYIEVSKIAIPYPSWGDVAYFGSVLFYIAAAFYLSKAVGVGISLKNVKYKFVAVIVPLALLVVSYLILLHNHHFDTSHPLTVFLDVGYPVGEALYISIGLVSFLLSKKLLGGVLKPAILFVLFALLVQYISDFSFVFKSNRNSYVPGDWVDLMYLISYYLMSLAMLKFYITYKSLRAKNKESENADA